MTVLESKRDTPEVEKPFAAVSVKNVLYATDFSPTSESALPYATAICHRFGATLHVAHVLSDVGFLFMAGGVDYVSMGSIYEDAQNAAKEKLDQITERLGKISSRAYVRHGKVWKNLNAIVSEHSIDLIIIGTHGRTGLGKLLLGSVAEEILRHSSCPVLTVGPEVRGRARLPQHDCGDYELVPLELEMRQILCAAKLSPASLQVARAAIVLAGDFHAKLTLMHVLEQYENPGSPKKLIEEKVQQLQAIVPKEAALAYAPDFVIEVGPAAQSILDAAQERDADLIVMGVRPSEGAPHLPGSTFHRVVANAPCPVLTVLA
jgi:nucleotide-binding universal stress UspA family protein